MTSTMVAQRNERELDEALRVMAEALVGIERVDGPVYAGECPDCHAGLMDDHGDDCRIVLALQHYVSARGGDPGDWQKVSRW